MQELFVSEQNPVMDAANLYHSQAEMQVGSAESRGWGTAIADTVSTTAVSAVIGLANTAISATNFFTGGNTAELDTYSVIKGLDAEAAGFYLEHTNSIDALGTVVGGLVPGGLGVKAFRAAAAGLEARKITSVLNLHEGLIGGREALYQANKTAEVVTSALSSQYLSLAAKGVGANLLDAFAFESAATLAQMRAPAYSELTSGNLVENVFWNSLTGGVIGGAFSSAKTYYGLRDAKRSGEIATWEQRYVKADARQSPEVEIVALLDSRKTIAAETMSPVEIKAATAANSSIRAGLHDSFSRLIGDGEDQLTKAVVAATSKVEGKAHYEYIPGVKSISTLAKHDEEQLLLAEQRVLAESAITPKSSPQARGKITSIANEQVAPKIYVDLRTNNHYTSRSDIPATLGDMVVTNGKLEATNLRSAVSVDGKGSIIAVGTYSPEATVAGLQAKRWLLATGAQEAKLHVTSRDYADIEYHLQNWNAKDKEFAVVVDGRSYKSATELRMDMMENKKDDLLAAGYSREAQAKLNTNLDPLAEPKAGWDIDVPHEAAAAYYSSPRIAVFSYDPKVVSALKDGAVTSEGYIQAKSALAADVRDKVFESFSTSYNGLPKLSSVLTDAELQKLIHRNAVVSQEGAGAAFLAGANAKLDSLTNALQKIGGQVSNTTIALQDATGVNMRNHWARLSSNWDTHGAEFIQVRNKLALSEANYAVITPKISESYNRYMRGVGAAEAPTTGLIRQDVAKYLLAAAEKGKLPGYAAEDLAISGDRFIRTSEAIHDLNLAQANINLKRRLHTSAAQSSLGFQDRVKLVDSDDFIPVYNVPVDTSRYGHFALVSAKEGIGAGSHKSILTAKDAESLELKIAALRNDPETAGKFDFYLKGETADFKKALGEYEYSRGMNENLVDATMRRKGMLGELNPGMSSKNVTDSIQDMINWNNRMDARLARDMTELKYAQTFQQLNHLGQQQALLSSSYFGTDKNWWYQAKDNKYADLVKLALNISNRDNHPVWSMANEFAERTASTAFGTIGKLGDALYQSAGKDLDGHVARINEHLDSLGLGKGYTAGMMTMHRDLVAQRPILYSSIQRAQSIFSGLTLGLDPLNAANNAIGNVMLVGELSSLLKGIRKNSPEIAGSLAGVTIPGTTDSFFGSVKLVMSAIARYFKGGTVFDYGSNQWKEVSSADLLGQYVDHGIVAGELRQARMLQEEFASNLNPTVQWLNAKTDEGLELGRKITGNGFAERFSRFLAADVARQITDHASAAKLISSEAEAATYWMTTANRAQGNIISSQRPVAFQGAIGTSIGLFMSYQLNMMQQFARYAGTGQLGAAGVAIAAQTSLYGLQGLPAFNAINTHLIGNAGGNIDHRDLYTTVKRELGDDKVLNGNTNVGDWLLYGAGSNSLGLFHPDLKLNLYTRGDINPRQWTVLPISISDTPIYKATVNTMKNFIDTVQNMSGGAGVRESLLHAMEHNGLNRPLSGLGAVLQGKETSSDGKLLAAIDNNFLAGMVKLAGGKGLDSATANDALYRMRAYEAHDAAVKKELAQELRISVGSGGDTSQEQLDAFQMRYVVAGGKIDGFNKWAIKQYQYATVPQANLFASNQQSRLSINMQDIMGVNLLKGLKAEPDIGEEDY
jgi:hypothetical protein